MSNSRRLTIGQNINGGESGGGSINTSNYMTILALEDGLQARLRGNTISYSLDEGNTWTSLASNTYTPSVNSGQTIIFKGNLTPNSSTGIGTFTISKKCNLEGNCMSMLFGDNAVNNNSLSGKNYAFYKLFFNCTTIIQVSETFLPATTLADSCYDSMFKGCRSLTVAPELPATTLASSCYYGMFEGCTNLTTAPELPATTLADNCYAVMFFNCTSLTTAPALPVTTLTSNCYSNMFYGCTSLTMAPALPATTLASTCYYNMFQGCTSLTEAPELPATTLANNCYYYMFNGCSSLTVAPELPATTLANGCYYYMFNGCTSLTVAPELPATTLANNCYYYMFNGCTSLTVAPELPATTLANNCYYYMFNGTNVLPDCSNIDFTSSTVVSSGGLQGLFAGTKVTDNDLYNILPINPATGKYWLPATTLTSYCYYRMFENCTSLTTAPELPATTLANGCYSYMFYGCSSLTTGPSVLPAITLASSCYYNMFNGCSKLNYIKMLATDISASSCLSNWVTGVSSTGTFVKNPAMTSLPNGINGIPSGWTVVDDN